MNLQGIGMKWYTRPEAEDDGGDFGCGQLVFVFGKGRSVDVGSVLTDWVNNGSENKVYRLLLLDKRKKQENLMKNDIMTTAE